MTQFIIPTSQQGVFPFDATRRVYKENWSQINTIFSQSHPANTQQTQQHSKSALRLTNFRTHTSRCTVQLTSLNKHGYRGGMEGVGEELENLTVAELTTKFSAFMKNDVSLSLSQQTAIGP